jgi:LmbE family N-acetylglucosaminyl deacetylase
MEKTTRPKRVLFFSAHPDDEIGSAGGFILKTLKEGGAVRLSLCIDPAEPRLDQSAATEREQRLLEFATVASAIGAEHSFLNFPHYPPLSYEMILPCVSEIRLFKPDIIALLHEGDYHTEHQLIARIVKRAVWHAARSAFPECGESHKTSELWEAEGDRPLPDPNHFEDISEYAQAKKETFFLYGSQQARKDLASAFIGINAFRGIMYKKGSFAEAFKTSEFFYG